MKRGFVFQFGHLRGRACAWDAYWDFWEQRAIFVERGIPFVIEAEELSEFVIFYCLFAATG